MAGASWSYSASSCVSEDGDRRGSVADVPTRLVPVLPAIGADRRLEQVASAVPPVGYALRIDMPAFHARDLAERLDRSWRAGQDAVEELAAGGIVRQLSAGKGNRFYEVPEIFALLDSFEHDPERLVAIGASS